MPDQLPGVEIVGQRRLPGGAFPTGGSSGTGGGPGEGGVHQNEVGMEDPPVSTPDPCADPDTALPWNADAAAAAAVGAFLDAAGQLGYADAPGGSPSLSNREFGQGLARSGSSVSGNQVSWGSPVSPGATSSMSVDMTGITQANYIGDVHSHPNGNPLPSLEDWNGFLGNNRAAREYGRTDETFYMYIIAVDSSGGPPSIFVYQDGPRAANSPDPTRPTTVGPEVNPEAQPCP